MVVEKESVEIIIDAIESYDLIDDNVKDRIIREVVEKYMGCDEENINPFIAASRCPLIYNLD